jgi:hypothetical protein
MIHAAQTVFMRTNDPDKFVAKITSSLISAPAEDDPDQRGLHLFTITIEDAE